MTIITKDNRPTEPLSIAFLDNVTVLEPLNIADVGCANLYIRVTPVLTKADGEKIGGTKSWAMIYKSRITGLTKTVKGGTYPERGLKDARQWCNEQRTIIGNGKVEASFAGSTVKVGLTVDEAFAKYDAARIVNLKQQRNVRVAMRTVIDRQGWNNLPLVALDRDMLVDAFEYIRDDRGSPKQARNVQTMFSTFLTWAIEARLIKANPIAGMRSVATKSKPRRRWLENEDELRTFVGACLRPAEHGLHQDFADALLLILATSARPGMICALSDALLKNGGSSKLGHNGGPRLTLVSAADSRPYADFPAAMMKKARDFVLPLNSIAMAIIERRRGRGLLFPTRSQNVADKGKSLQVRSLAAACQELSRRLGWTAEGEGVGSPVHPHDLRRTAASWLLAAKPDHRDDPYCLDDVGQLLSHAAEGSEVTAVYDGQARFKNFTRKRELSDWLATIITTVTDLGDDSRLAA